MAWIIRYTIKWIVQGWIIEKLAKRLINWMIEKYSLGENFIQSFTKPHEVDWNSIRWFAVFARMAYKKDNDVIRAHYKDYDVYINEINEVKYIVISDSIKKEQYISVRGTSNSHNALQDINFLRSKSRRLGISLHSGFHRTAELIADDLIPRLDTTWTTWVTGHSLGAADALIVGWYLDHAGHSVAECINFGQPKVTDSRGIHKMRDKIKITRVVNETDIVPLVPPSGTHVHRYAHNGELLKLLDNGKYCFLEEPDSLNYGVNSFWLFAARESFSFYEIGKELPDHFMDNYIDNIDAIIAETEEVNWKDRLGYLDNSGIAGEWI